MSEAETQHIATLLPQSSVAIYSTDKETLEAGRDLPGDWRFARVSVQVEEGDLDSAISAYQDLKSPNLIIIQTEKLDETFTQKLGDLAECCAEGTNAIVIGPVNDVYLYRQLIDMGVSDYLVKPVDTGMLSEVIAGTLIEQIGVSGSRLIACIGAKGGVGTSSLVEAMGWSMAEILKQKTIIIDPSGGWSTHPVGIGFEPASTLAEAARAAENTDEDNLKRMIFQASERLMVLSTGGDVMLEPAIDTESLEGLLDNLMAKYPVVLVDLSGCPSDIKKTICSRANKIVVVTTATPPSLRLTRGLVQEIKDVRGNEDGDIHLVLNMEGFSSTYELGKADIQKALGLKADMVLPFDPKVFVGVECEERNMTTDKDGKALLEKHILPFLSQLLDLELEQASVGQASAKSGFLGRLLGKMGSKK